MKTGEDKRGAGPLVSVNIPTYNSERTLERCLGAVRAQSCRDFELIVIDAYSRDRTREIAESRGAVVVSTRGLMAQRKLGIEKSKGEFILLLDSDQLLAPDALESCLKACREKEAQALMLPEKTVIERQNWLTRMTSLNMEAVQGDDDVVTGTALPRFFESSLLKSLAFPVVDVGYYDHAFIYREVQKKGARVAYAKTVVSHLESNTVRGMMRKFYRFYGLSFIPALRCDRELVLGRSLPKKVYARGSVWRSPGRALALLLLYCMKASAALAGVAAYCLVYSHRKRV